MTRARRRGIVILAVLVVTIAGGAWSPARSVSSGSPGSAGFALCHARTVSTARFPASDTRADAIQRSPTSLTPRRACMS